MSGLVLRLDCAGDQGFSLQLDCELPATGITTVYGPSGSGKSTLLDCVAGLRRPQPGSVVRFRAHCWQEGSTFTPPWQRRIAYVFQDARLFPHLTVHQNLQYGLSRRREDGVTAAEVIDWLELADLLERAPAALSAGQRQRVAIGRALLSGPELLLLDEPVANLDHVASQQCLHYLQRLAQEQQVPMLYISHDIEEVSQMADHLVILERGRMIDQGSPLDLCSQLDSRLSQDEQAAAILVGTIARHDPEFSLTEMAVENQTVFVRHQRDQPGQLRRLRIPARDVSICRHKPDDSSILNVLAVTLEQIAEQDNARVLLRLALGSQFLLARITRKSANLLQLKIGDRLFAQIKSAALLMEVAVPYE